MSTIQNIFFDLDDTLWNFSENARDAFQETYAHYNFDAYFDSFEHYYSLYEWRNVQLWDEYGVGKITKSELNDLRFLYPLQAVGYENPELARQFAETFFSIVPTKSKLMPYAKEILDYLTQRNYNLYILSNGFEELQAHKMRSGGIAHYFRKVILSDHIGVMKPFPEIFHFALSATQSKLTDSIMIGDSWKADIVGAHRVGMRNIFYNVEKKTSFPFRPTHIIESLKELESIL